MATILMEVDRRFKYTLGEPLVLKEGGKKVMPLRGTNNKYNKVHPSTKCGQSVWPAKVYNNKAYITINNSFIY